MNLSDLGHCEEKGYYDGHKYEVGPSDYIITLSTCTGDVDVHIIVSTVRVDKYRR
ncbi:MAG: hypothetical protein IJ794_18355 [Lachnospiraceae bacterium]|nr:hypothetical protein [Lachnospiraceae bacterium]